MRFLALLTVLFHLDRLRAALHCCVLFAAANRRLTLIGLCLDERWYGLGYTAAAAVGTMAAGHCANRALARLEDETFATQPIARRFFP